MFLFYFRRRHAGGFRAGPIIRGVRITGWCIDCGPCQQCRHLFALGSEEYYMTRSVCEPIHLKHHDPLL